MTRKQADQRMEAPGFSGTSTSKKGSRKSAVAMAGLGAMVWLGLPLTLSSQPVVGAEGVGAGTHVAEQIVAARGGSKVGLWTPGVRPAKLASSQLIVKYRDSVAEPVHRLLARGGSFRSATTDRSASLDRLDAKFGVRSATPVFDKLLESLEIPSETRQATVKRLLAAKLDAVRRRYPQRAARATSAPLPDVSHIYVLDLAPGTDVTAAAREFGADPHVEYAQPNHVVTMQFLPNDPYYQSSGSWGQAYQDLWGLWKIQAGSAWDVTRGDGVVVAVVDTGLDIAHPDIAANVWSNPGEVVNGVDDDGNGYVDDTHGWDFASDDDDPADGHGHGTHVSGTIAAVGNNGLGISGVAPQAKVMPVKGLDDGGSGYSTDLAAGIIYAAQNGADVINNSWGCTGGCPSNPVAEDAVRMAHALGAVVVFAAGNGSANVAYYSPQNVPETITVTASTNIDAAASFSNFGAALDVAAPGAGENAAPPDADPFRAVLSLRAGNCNPGMCPGPLLVGDAYVRQAGTSMAAPHAAGVAALVLGARPSLTVEQVRQVLRRGSDDIGPAGFDEQFGYGRINAAAALAEPDPLEALITTPSIPASGSLMEVHGIATGPGFVSYTVEVGEGTMPTSWTTLAMSTTPVSPAGPIASWDLSNLADGAYTLRLTARNAEGRIYEDRQPATIDRVTLVDPPASNDEYTAIRGGGVISIVGTVETGAFSSYLVEVLQSPSGIPVPNADITLTDGGTHTISNGVLATWNTVDVPAGYYVIRLRVVLTSGANIVEDAAVIVDPTLHPGWPKDLGMFVAGGPLAIMDHLTAADVNRDGSADLLVGYGKTVRVFDHTGANLPGWPQSIDPDGAGDFLQKGVAIGDLTGDGDPEVVASSNAGRIFVWSSTGVLLPGWPASVTDGAASVSIADVDGNGTSEIVMTDWWGTVNVLSASAAPLPGWPRILLGSAGWDPISPPAVGDLDGDGKKEIAVMRLMGPNELYVLASNGAILPGWPRAMSPTAPVSEGYYLYPAMGELDSDPFREIVVCAADGLVQVLNHDGSDVPGWPQASLIAGTGSCSPPVIADVDGDGWSEVVVGVRSFEGQEVSLLYAWHRDGSPLQGWPVRYDATLYEPRGNGFSAAVVADLDGDGTGDVSASRDGRYSLNAYDQDGVELRGFPKPTITVHASSANTSAVADLDGDGLLELAWIDGYFNLYVWDLESPRSGNQPWPMFGHDAQRTGANLSANAPGAPMIRYDSHGGLAEIDGNGNGVVEPGETWELSVSLRNDGPVPAGGVSANLTVDPATHGAVFLLQGRSDYGTIAPGQVVSSLGAYRFRLGDDFPCGSRVVLSVAGITSTDPAGSYPDAVGAIRIAVGNGGESVSLFYDGFEPRGPSGPFWQVDGEWEVDSPRGLGGPQADPPSPYEGGYVLGTDLTGLGPNPGNYENGVASSVYSPFIPVSGVVPTEIRFAHWINLAQGDYATMRVRSDVPGDEKSFQWPGHGESSWTVESFDISDMAGNKEWLQVQILLQSDAQGTNSGWNMDAFEVRSPTCQAFDRTLPGEASNLLVRMGSAGQLALEWSADCGAATTYGIYRGDLRAGYNSIVAEPGMCDVTGTSATSPLGSGDAEFFLVVPHKDGEEGSYGTDASGMSRPPATGGCYPQGAVEVCAPRAGTTSSASQALEAPSRKLHGR